MDRRDRHERIETGRVMNVLGVYISVPFCKAKCTFCNFASDAFAPGRMEGYTRRLCREIADSRAYAARLGTSLPRRIDSIYFGGGTPSLLEPAQIEAIFHQLRAEFEIEPDAEMTLECAPGQLSNGTLDQLLRQGLNRISFGIQSFVDRESAAVGRLHTREICLTEIERVRAAGIKEVNIDLIAGLPLQTEASWRYSVDQAISAGSKHVSIYMLEVDEESRLGREALAHGQRYHAGEMPTEDQIAAWYQIACDLLADGDVHQYEISNFAREGSRSRHNLKYWQCHPYLGFGLDAHSMLLTATGAVRMANPDNLDLYLAEPAASGLLPMRSSMPTFDVIGGDAAFEESLFLGLRLSEGLSLSTVRAKHGDALVRATLPALEELCEAGLLEIDAERIKLTGRGRLLSNEVFSRILISAPA